jgi:hypothetical protein
MHNNRGIYIQSGGLDRYGIARHFDLSFFV